MSRVERPVLRVRNLRTVFDVSEGIVRAADGVNFVVGEQESFGIVGETGCGKSVTGLSIMRLIQDPGRIIDGEVWLDKQDLLKLTPDEMTKINGAKIAMIFQDPMTSLNPTLRVGEQVSEAILLHQDVTKQEAWDKAVDTMRRCGIPLAERRARDFPHQFSGGMRQRVLISIALSCNPRLLIADEPTTALDVTIQAQILELINDLKRDYRASLILITHDLGVVSEVCERVAVMYAGRIVEIADVETIFESPLHPYTRGLMALIPGLDDSKRQQLLRPIPGTVPDLTRPPPGCTFHPRCEYRTKRCSMGEPPLLTDEGNDHFVACFEFGRGEPVRWD